MEASTEQISLFSFDWADGAEGKMWAFQRKVCDVDLPLGFSVKASKMEAD